MCRVCGESEKERERHLQRGKKPPKESLIFVCESWWARAVFGSGTCFCQACQSRVPPPPTPLSLGQGQAQRPGMPAWLRCHCAPSSWGNGIWQGILLVGWDGMGWDATPVHSLQQRASSVCCSKPNIKEPLMGSVCFGQEHFTLCQPASHVNTGSLGNGTLEYDRLGDLPEFTFSILANQTNPRPDWLHWSGQAFFPCLLLRVGLVFFFFSFHPIKSCCCYGWPLKVLVTWSNGKYLCRNAAVGVMFFFHVMNIVS